MADKPSLLRRFFAVIWRTIALVYALVLLVVLLAVPLGVYFAFFGGAETKVVPDSALVWAPVGDLVEQRSGGMSSLLSSLVSEPQQQSLVRDLIKALDRARNDARINLVFLKLDELASAEPGQLQDLVAAIDRFKQSGKPVVAWSPTYNQAQYKLASHADTIYLDPLGYVYIPGYSAIRHYYKDALDKLGVEINVFRVGKYKSFVEPFTRNSMSDRARSDNRAWMTTLWQLYRKQAAATRSITAADISAYIDNFAATLQRSGGDAARMAKQAGLVDKIAGLHEVRAAVEKQVGHGDDRGSFRQIDQSSYLTATQSEQARPATDKRIGLVVVDGAIIDGESVAGSAGGDTVARMIADARRDADIAAILLRVNSPGGSVTASERIRRQVEITRGAGKPVVVSMAGVAASGGYWIAMNADQIWAQPATITGSIGIFAIVPTFGKPLNDLGIHTDGIGTTPLSGAIRLDQPLSRRAKQMLQAGIEHGYEAFISRVAAARNIDEVAVRRIAQGRVWSGVDAERIGLVDKLGGFAQAERAAGRLAGLQPADYRLQSMQPPAGWRTALRHFIASRTGSALVPDWLTALDGDHALAWLRHGLNDPRHLYARCFCALGGADRGFAGIANESGP